MQSRLSRTTAQKSKRQLILYIGGIIIVLFVLFQFGIPALTNLSLFLSSRNASSSPTNTNSGVVVAAPTLDQPFTATGSAHINVSGTAEPKTTVQLYVNSTLVDTTPVKTDGTFAFSGVTLSQQQNTIQAKEKKADKTSDYSDSWVVTYLQKAPSLTIDNPHDNDSFDSSHPTVVVSGKTDPNVKITVNDFWAIVDGSGNYSYTLALQNGDNHIVVVATDAAGNTTKQEITVHHSQ